MDVLLLEMFEKEILPFVLKELVQSGVMNQLTASAITSYEQFLSFMKGIKTYSAPTDFPNPPPQELTPNNLASDETEL